MRDFFAMGGYAAYVWSAFGFAALVLVALLGQSWWAARQREEELAQLRQIVRPGKASRPRLQPVARSGEARATVDRTGEV